MELFKLNDSSWLSRLGKERKEEIKAIGYKQHVKKQNAIIVTCYQRAQLLS